jgi:hypothetical protein
MNNIYLDFTYFLFSCSAFPFFLLSKVNLFFFWFFISNQVIKRNRKEIRNSMMMKKNYSFFKFEFFLLLLALKVVRTESLSCYMGTPGSNANQVSGCTGLCMVWKIITLLMK